MLDDLKRVVEFANPTNLRELRRAGSLSAKDPVGLAMGLPWLVGRGQSLGIMSQAHAVSIGDKVAVHDRRGSVTFRELDKRVNQGAHLLGALGVEPGGRVALLVRNGREWMEIVLAGQKIGVTVCPLNTWAKPKELRSTIGTSDPTVLFYETAHAEQVAQCAPDDLETVWVGNEQDALPDSTSYEAMLADQPPTPPTPFTRHKAKARVVIHTSGTTGTPKGAQRDASAAGIGAMANLLKVVPYHRDDVVVCPAPLFHSFGLATFTFATVLGMTLVLPERFDPEETLALVEDHRATALSLVPVMLRRIVKLDEQVKSRYDVSSLRILLASGSAMSTDLRKAAIETFGEVVYDLYGSTEAGWVSVATPADMRKHPNTVGRPTPGIDVAVLSPSGERLPPGASGELFVKSKVTFEGYTGGGSKDERDGYMSTGDNVRINSDGYIFVEGRADEMVVVGGENIYPIEIESTIEDIDGVDEAAVLGIDDEEYGQVLAAFVKGTVNESVVEEACEKELASYKVPRRIFIVDDFPRTSSTGKIVKADLKEIAEERSKQAAGANGSVGEK